jgi:hypothetical protein
MNVSNVSLIILLGLIIVISTIYAAKKYRSKWIKICLYLFASLSTLSTAIMVLVLIELKKENTFIQESKDERSKGIVKQFCALNFTNTFADVIYKKRSPRNVYSNEYGGIILGYGLGPDVDSMEICFNNRVNGENQSTNIIYSIFSTVEMNIVSCDLGNIRIGSSLSDVQKEFKEKLVEKLESDLNRRLYQVGNIKFHFKNGKLEGVTVYNTNSLINGSGTNWVQIE